MKSILKSLFTILFVGVLAVGASRAYFSDTEEVLGTFTAGTIDLTVDGANETVSFNVDNMKPGEVKGSPTYQICNAGTIPGTVTMSVGNFVSGEGNLVEPETTASDANDTRLDPDGFTIATSGYGELLDQVVMRFWVDDTPGLRPAPFDWQDKYWEGYPDESSYYSLPINTDLMSAKNFVLSPGSCGYMGVVTSFIDDTNTPYAWILDGIANNAAMSDSISFDLNVGLKQ